MSEKIKLQSNDGEIFEVDIKVAKCCGTIEAMIDSCGLDDAIATLVVPLPNVKASILRKVLAWAEHHKDDPELPEPKIDLDDYSEPSLTDVSPFDAQFLRVDQATLFDLIMAANYLDCKGLLQASCKTIAKMIIGRTPDDITRIFRVPSE